MSQAQASQIQRAMSKSRAGLLGWLPEAWQRRGLRVFLAAMFAFDALAFWGYLAPFFNLRA